MPIFEFWCKSQTNPECARVQEHYLRHASDPNQCCDVCGGETARLVSVCHAIWLKPLGEYNDPKKEGYRENLDGHIMYRKRSTRNPDGSPEPVRIRTRQEQQTYCRDEGLAMPDEIGNVEVSADGKRLQSQGQPGCWV